MFARAVRECFDFIDARGHFRDSGRLAALCAFEVAGRITLPSGIERKLASPRLLMLSMPVAPTVRVPQRVDGIWGLTVKWVDTKAEARLLARILHDEYSQDAVQHGGWPWRYLITSDHGVLGGFVFACPALALKPRGWGGIQITSPSLTKFSKNSSNFIVFAIYRNIFSFNFNKL